MNINLGTAAKNKNKFDFSHDVVTTSNFGWFQPVLCREVIPNTDIDLTTETFVRLANMVCPSFGQIKVKNSYAFVPFRLVYPNFTQLLQNQPVNGSNGQFIPEKVPTFNYVGLWLNMLLHPGTFTPGSYSIFDEYGELIPIEARLVNSPGLEDLFGEIDVHDQADDVRINEFKYVFQFKEFSDGKYYCTNYSRDFYIDDIDLHNAGHTTIYLGFTPSVQHQTYINLYSKLFNGLGYTLPSFFGSDLRFNSQGLDVTTVNLTRYTYEESSCLQVLAYMRYYYEHLSPQREVTFQDTETHKFIELFRDRDGVYIMEDDGGDPDSSSLNYLSYFGLFASIVGSAAQCYYTLPPDIFTSSLSTINNDTSSINVVQNTASSSTDARVVSSPGYVPSAQLRNDTLNATLIQGLLKMLKYSNRNTLVGRQVTNWLQSRFGIVSNNEFTNTCHHLGMQNTDVQISDIYATANSEGEFGQTLGSYSGRGIGFNTGKHVSFKAKEYGFFIGLQTVVPITDYYQGVKPDVQRTERFDFFTSEFENLGYEALPNRNIQVNSSNIRNVFGFIPRYASYKYMTSLVNGDFANGYRDMSAYHLMRTLPNNVILSEQFRKLSQDTVLGNDEGYNRIFANTSSALDHFLIFNRMHFKLTQPMEVISRSYDVEEHGNGKFSVDYT